MLKKEIRLFRSVYGSVETEKIVQKLLAGRGKEMNKS